MHPALVLLGCARLVALGLPAATEDESLGVLLASRLGREHLLSPIPLRFLLLLVGLPLHLLVGLLLLVGLVATHVSYCGPAVTQELVQ